MLRGNVRKQVAEDLNSFLRRHIYGDLKNDATGAARVYFLSFSAPSSGLVGLLTYFGTVSRRVARSLIRSYGRKGGETGDLEEQPTGSMYTCPVGSCHQPPLSDPLVALPFSPSPASQPTPTHFCGHVLAYKQPSQTFLVTPVTFSFRAFSTTSSTSDSISGQYLYFKSGIFF